MKNYCAALAEEFRNVRRKSELRLSAREFQTFATSPFFATTRGFYHYRVAVATYMVLVLFVSVLMTCMNMDGSIRLYLIYYTRWSLLVVVTYLLLAAHITKRYAQLCGELPLSVSNGAAGGTVGRGVYATFGTPGALFSGVESSSDNAGTSTGLGESGAGGVLGETEIDSIGDIRPATSVGGADRNSTTGEYLAVRPDTLLRATWLLQNVIYPNTLMVTLLFWLVVYPGVTFNHLTADDDLTKSCKDDESGGCGGDNDGSSEEVHYSAWRMAIVTQEHGTNLAVMALDVFLSRAPYRMVAHAHHAAAYAAAYVAFSVIYFLACGRNDSGKRYIYPQLDWATPVPTATFVALSFVVLLPAIMWATWTWCYCGRYLGNWVLERRAQRLRHAGGGAAQQGKLLLCISPLDIGRKAEG